VPVTCATPVVQRLTSEVLWQVTPLLAQWFVAPNVLAATGVVRPQAHVLELGCGISGLLAMALAPLVETYVATDTGSVAGSKTLRQNLEQNTQAKNIAVRSLDWESDSVARLYDELGLGPGQQIDLLVACDCIYNEALIAPFVETCVEICRLARDGPTVCLVAQQLRSPDVFEQWLAAFHDKFRAWRLPRHLIGEALSDDSGFAVHIGVLRSG
jgi:predicted nicotinamide N-methyase